MGGTDWHLIADTVVVYRLGLLRFVLDTCMYILSALFGWVLLLVCVSFWIFPPCMILFLEWVWVVVGYDVLTSLDCGLVRSNFPKLIEGRRV